MVSRYCTILALLSPIWTDPGSGYYGEYRSLPVYQILVLGDFGSGYIRSIVVAAKFEQITAYFLVNPGPGQIGITSHSYIILANPYPDPGQINLSSPSQIHIVSPG